MVCIGGFTRHPKKENQVFTSIMPSEGDNKIKGMTVSTRRILVVDDEAMVCESVRLLLAYDGHQVETASSGPEAIAKIESGTYDVVFTDFSMPGMKGDELARKIKERDPGKPVILLTAFPPAIQPQAVDLIITKPFYLATLREGLDRVLEKK